MEVRRWTGGVWAFGLRRPPTGQEDWRSCSSEVRGIEVKKKQPEESLIHHCLFSWEIWTGRHPGPPTDQLCCEILLAYEASRLIGGVRQSVANWHWLLSSWIHQFHFFWTIAENSSHCHFSLPADQPSHPGPTSARRTAGGAIPQRLSTVSSRWSAGKIDTENT